MNNKAEELEVRNIMQGLEEFANFMSFRSTTSNLRILSVETVEQERQRTPASSTADILDLQQHVKKKRGPKQQVLNKSLSFVDRQVS
ncbi:MAG: hypothetical protein GQ548_03495 [Methylophaga sp.]|nr:hypothetical protein [Methylophaga sp.]